MRSTASIHPLCREQLLVVMHTLTFLLASLCAVASARLSCKVPHLGGGRDDGPAINAAFERCAKGGKVVLDQYYSVDTLLFTTGLDDVEIELSGTGMCSILPSHPRLHVFNNNLCFSTIHTGYCKVVTPELLPNVSKRVGVIILKFDKALTAYVGLPSGSSRAIMFTSLEVVLSTATVRSGGMHSPMVPAYVFCTLPNVPVTYYFCTECWDSRRIFSDLRQTDPLDCGKFDKRCRREPNRNRFPLLGK
jgi:hypothetical protein